MARASDKPEEQPSIHVLQEWVNEAKQATGEARTEMYRDEQVYDGGKGQWTSDDWDNAKAAGLDPVTINRTWPICNLILGSEVINKFETVAKGRTQDDTELGQVMTESVKFVMDQNDGEFLITSAFRGAVIPGMGCIQVVKNNDPRQEKIKLAERNYKDMGWDPFASPWFKPETCRYLYFSRWTDLRNLQGMFPEKRQEIADAYNDMTHTLKDEMGGDEYTADYATEIEYDKRFQIAISADAERKRVRPVEIWYPLYESAHFATFADGRVVELANDMDPMDQYQIITNSQAVVKASVKKMHSCTFMGNLELQRSPTPHSHDEYPFVPFIGYLDRFMYPYGIPRQIRGQDEEINKRRTMALQLLKSRRVIIERGAVKDGDEGLLQDVHEEINKTDGFVVVEDQAIGKKKIHIMEGTDLAPAQVALMQQSEQEMKEIVGANDERMGEKSNVTSGKALERKEKAGATMTASLFDNQRRSLKTLGTLVGSDIQGFWTEEKILRITDRMTGADRFVELNKKIQGENGAIEVKNNITQGKFDFIVSEAPETDTVREKNVELIIEWVKKSPPEVIPQLMSVAFEISDLPNKEKLLAKIQPLLGNSPEEADMEPEQLKQKIMDELEAAKQEEAKAKEYEDQEIQLELKNKDLENQKLEAEIKSIEDGDKMERAKTTAEIQAKKTELSIKEDEVDIKEKVANKPTPKAGGSDKK